MANIWVNLDIEQEEDKDRLYLLLEGWKYRSILRELDQYLRNRLKYEELTDQEAEALQKARDYLWEQINDHNVEVD